MFYFLFGFMFSIINKSSLFLIKKKQTFFPDISEPHGLPIKIRDTEGKEWEFRYRSWPNGDSKMYVLEGLRDYMISMKWQAGDVGNMQIILAVSFLFYCNWYLSMLCHLFG